MLEIILFILGSGAASAGNKYFAKQKQLDKELSVCRDCKTENPISAKFCKNCKSQNLVRRKEFKKEQYLIFKETVETEEQAKAVLKRVNLAKEFHDVAINCRVCKACDESFVPDTWHCTSCGNLTQLVSSDTVLSWLILDYPDIVQSANDVEFLARYHPDEGITLGKVVVKTGAKLAKAGLWASKKLITSVAAELDKK